MYSNVNTRSLDFLRGLAALVVVMNHTRAQFFTGASNLLTDDQTVLGVFDYLCLALLQITALGTEAVIVFFCLSGFCIAHAVQNSKSAWRFFLRRSIRLWPTFCAGLTGAYVTHFFLSCKLELLGECHRVEFFSIEFFLKFFYINPSLPSAPQFWSLPYEVFFYLLAPFILLRSRIVIFFWISVLFYVTCFYIFGARINPSSYFFIDFFGNSFFWFMSGALLYKYQNEFPRIEYWITIAFFVLAIVWIVKFIFGYSNIYSNTLMIIFAVIVITNISSSSQIVSKFNFGEMSYSLYVFHYAPILVLMGAFEINGLTPKEFTSYIAWVLPLIIIIGYCFLCYIIFERPFIKILRSF